MTAIDCRHCGQPDTLDHECLGSHIEERLISSLLATAHRMDAEAAALVDCRRATGLLCDLCPPDRCRLDDEEDDPKGSAMKQSFATRIEGAAVVSMADITLDDEEDE